ncbi:hypothetical protein DCS_02869 [Drechmeria coniospora]|uniref:ER membrane protein complex subunit 7 beta-sandwich domain-containing protein n=1 Tax=Drechmeria coniospora TaxID=98403 RepID=A0A151GX97_DRECN|nr:hypothetical protein DCS_02869 [Drechmeria coniospora]KYK61726.1 hypothetical protein DCS_02869 [Drechmeria coniospora]ODA82529.1 hypothetical protein RJ55_01036 [Drechmeria coniospora]
MHLPPILGALATLLLTVTAHTTTDTTTVTILLPANPNPFTLSSRTHATLSSLGVHYDASVSTLNAFVFRNVSAGSYLLDVHCPTEAYRPLRIDVTVADGVQAWQTFRGNEWSNKGEAVPAKEGGGFEVSPMGRKTYFIDRPAFSIFSILKNPMILMGLVSMVIFIGMPYLMDSMDPEMKAEFEAQQRKGPMAALMGGAASSGGAPGQNPLGDFDMAAYLSGSSKKDSASRKASGGSGASKNQAGRI